MVGILSCFHLRHDMYIQGQTDRLIEHGTRCSEDTLLSGTKHRHRHMYIYESLRGRDAESRRPLGAHQQNNYWTKLH